MSRVDGKFDGGTSWPKVSEMLSLERCQHRRGLCKQRVPGMLVGIVICPSEVWQTPMDAHYMPRTALVLGLWPVGKSQPLSLRSSRCSGKHPKETNSRAQWVLFDQRSREMGMMNTARHQRLGKRTHRLYHKEEWRAQQVFSRRLQGKVAV